MKENKCIFCSKKNLNITQIRNRNYNFCNECGGIFVSKSDFLSENEQKKRYELHNNDLKNEGYKKFLLDFIMPVLDFVKNNYQISENFTIFDFGSGVKPCLCELLERFITSGFIPENTKIYKYDKFFSPEKNFVASDLCVSLETIEHFDNLNEDLLNLSSCVKSGGFLAVGTNLIPDSPEFEKWWYKEDKTHVCFFTLEALKLCLARVNLMFVKSLSNRCFIFKKS